MTAPDPAITVLVSTSRHPVSGLPCANRNDLVAMELGRQLSQGSPRVVHAGDPADPALLDYLAYGARVVEVLPAAAGDDLSRSLAEPIRDSRLILCGCRSKSGASTGMLPYLLAAALNRPVITDVVSVDLGDGIARLVQFLPKGKRRRIEVYLPAVIAIHPLAPVVPRYAYARRIAGRVQRVTSAASVPSAPSVSSAPAPPWATSAAPKAVRSAAAPFPLPSWPEQVPGWQIDAAARAPVKLKAPDRRSGHARMLAATAAARSGGQVVNEGSSVEKAQVVLAYLREHGLINF